MGEQFDSLPHPCSDSSACVRKSEHEQWQWDTVGEFDHYLTRKRAYSSLPTHTLKHKKLLVA
jgi:hypothetical protein